MRANRNVIQGLDYRVVLPTPEDVRAFTRFVNHLMKNYQLTRLEAVRRTADRCNVKCI